MDAMEEIIILKKRLGTIERDLGNAQNAIHIAASKQTRDNNSVLCDVTDILTISAFDIVKIYATTVGKPKCIPYSTSGHDDAMIGVALEGSLRSNNIRVCVSGVTYVKVDGTAEVNEGLNPVASQTYAESSENNPKFFTIEKFESGAELALVRFATGNTDSYDGQFAVKLATGSQSRIQINAGKCIAGLTVFDFIGSNAFAPSGPYVYVIAYYAYSFSSSGRAWYVTFYTYSEYPDQSKQGYSWAVRKLIATLTISEGNVTKIKQEHTGEFHIAGRVV